MAVNGWIAVGWLVVEDVVMVLVLVLLPALSGWLGGGTGRGSRYALGPQVGGVEVSWDAGGRATPLGRRTFFAELIEVWGFFARWRDGCPLCQTSLNAPGVVDVLGKWLSSMLDGQWRYADVAGLRGDEVAPEILGQRHARP